MIHMKIMLLTLCCLFGYSRISFANIDKIAMDRHNWQVEHFKKEGAPIPDGGITIVPITQLSHYHLIKEKRAKQQQDIAQFGYIDVRNDINHKTTTVQVSGNQNSGFLYDIEWYDLTFFRQLQCAHSTYSPDVVNQIVELAKSIDFR